MKRLVPLAFLVIATADGVDAIGAINTLATHGGGRRCLLTLYAVLRTAIAFAFAFFTAQRPDSHRRTRNPLALIACAVAMLAVLPVGGPSNATSSQLLLVSDTVAVAASAWIFASVLVLGRCFGVLPEARGLVTRGPYRLVRHPVYLGEIVAMGGLTIAAPSLSHLVILAAFILAQSVRMGLEERALREAFAEYANYAARTGRLLPRLASPLDGTSLPRRQTRTTT